MDAAERKGRGKILLVIAAVYIVVLLVTLTVGRHRCICSFDARFYALIIEMGLLAHVMTYTSGLFHGIQKDLDLKGRPTWLAIPICFLVPLLGVFAYIVFRAKGWVREAQEKAAQQPSGKDVPQ